MQVVIIVNVASECGFTHSAYEGLYYLAEDIQRDYPNKLQVDSIDLSRSSPDHKHKTTDSRLSMQSVRCARASISI